MQGQPPARLFGDRLGGRGRQHDDPILVALALANGELVALQVHILDAQAAAFHNAQPGPVHESGHQTVRLGSGQPIDGVEKLANLVAGKDDGQAAAAAGADGVEGAEVEAEDVAVEEEQGGEGLVLGAAATRRWTARWVRNFSISAAPMSAGWRKPSGPLWKRMYCSAQRT